MRLMMLGINHRTAEVALRERAAFAAEDVPSVLRQLRRDFPGGDEGHGPEALLLSTCNRTEFYLACTADPYPDADALRRWWAAQRDIGIEDLTGATLLREQAPVVRHLFRVVAGLDSQIVGEPEVQHQVKRAYALACNHNTVGPVLHQIFQGAIASARKARHDTGLSRAGASIGSVALQFARTVFDTFSDKTVVTLGAGEIAKATLRPLLRQNPKRTWIVNRSVERARETAAALGLGVASGATEPSQSSGGGGVRPWDDLDAALVDADVLVCATAAPQPVVTTERVRGLLRRRRNRPLVVLDLALPRDVEPGVGALGNVYLYNLDDLREVVDHDPQRRDAIDRCEQHVGAAAQAAYNQLQHRNVGQLVRQLRQKMQQLAEVERQRSARKVDAQVQPDQREAIDVLLDEFGHRLVNKILHLPLQQMDTRAGDASLGFYAAALRRLFDLDEGEAMPPEKTESQTTRNESEPDRDPTCRVPRTSVRAGSPDHTD